MKTLISIVTSLIFTLSTWAQCNVVATAMGGTLLCNGDCNGTITYVYQNTGTLGAPYVVTLSNQTTGQFLSATTYIQEYQTIPFTGLCAGNYQITIQGQGCSFTTSASIIQPTQITAYVNTFDPTPGSNNGSATIIATGGTGALTYSLNGTTYQGSNVFSGLAAGNYTAYVKDAYGCIEQLSFTLTDPAICNIVVTANGASTLCYGACNAVIQYAYSNDNNNGPFVIELQNASGQVFQTATNASSTGIGSFSNVCSGVYVIEVTDANGCSGSYNYTLNQPNQLLISNIITTNTTTGNSNGSVTITASGGTAPYTYSLNGITYQSSNVFTGLAGGVHIAYVMDQNGCVSIYTFIIQVTTACSVVMTSQASNVLCAFSCSGSIIYTYTMAIAPVTIVVESNGNTIQSTTNQFSAGNGTFSNLCAGSYSVTITDAAGCSYVNNVQVGQPAQLIVTATGTSPTFGNNNGSITITATGGNTPYQYALNAPTGWQTSNTFAGLAPGVYIAYAQDANGCINIYTIQLTQIAGCALAITGAGNPNTCAYSTDGSVNYTFTGSGVGLPFTISLLSNGTTVQSATSAIISGSGIFSNVAEGIYTLQITATNGCIYTQQVYVDAPNPITVSNIIVDNTAAGMSNGSAEIILSGGTAPYQFSIDNGLTWGTSNVLTGLAAGIYITQIEDVNGCSTIVCFIVNEDPGCTITTIMTLIQPMTCFWSCNAALYYSYTALGDNGPYTIALTNNGAVVNTSTSNLSSFSGSFTNLCAGNYNFTVTDVNGCTSNVSTVTIAETQQIIISVDVTDATTGNNNGVVVINATGGTGQYSYGLNPSIMQSSNVFTGLAAGVYIAYVQDANGCQSIYTFLVNTQTSCNLILTASQTNSNMCSGSCNASISYVYNDQTMNAPYIITLGNTNGVVQTQELTSAAGSGSFTNVCAGTYTVTVQSANGCSSISTVIVNSPSYMSISPSQVNPTAGNSDGSITMNVTGGTPAYEYSIDNQTTWQAGSTFDNLPNGVYIIYIRDQNGCMQIYCVLLGSPTANIIELEENISVYPNPTNGLVFLNSENIESTKVYTLNGQVLSLESIKAVNGSVIDLGNIADGLYILEITMANGKVNRSHIVKE